MKINRIDNMRNTAISLNGQVTVLEKCILEMWENIILKTAVPQCVGKGKGFNRKSHVIFFLSGR